MSASASIEIQDVPRGRNPVVVGVYRYRGGGFEPLANVRVLSIRTREGADPGVARFRYVFDPSNAPGDPTSFEQALAVDSGLPGVVRDDERLVVLASYPDGSPLPLFDGFAQVPELDLSPTGEGVSFSAFGVAVRAWDTPVGGALMRDADNPVAGGDAATDVVAQFNPQGRPNATPAGAEVADRSGNVYPTFLDPLVVRDPDVRRKWSIPMAVRYLCGRENAAQAYVRNPDGATIDALFDSRTPASGAGLDQSNPAGVESDPLEVPDYPATGKAWPNAVEELIRPAGFGMAFRLEADDAGNPVTTLDLFRRQDGSPAVAKDLFLQTRGSLYDPNQTNVSAAQLARDCAGVANAYTVESELVRYEATFILAPAFAVAAADAASPASLRAFDRNDPSFARVNHDKYRLYTFDETGEGHWDWSSSAMVTKATSLAPLLGGDSRSPQPVAKRRRVPIGTLFSLDPNRKPLAAQLSISTDYAGTQPGLWDGTGTWQPVQGGFELLRDRLGVWIHAANPNGWAIGASKSPGAPYPAGVVRGVEAQAVPGGGRFTLRLTCVIEGDRCLTATADRRPSSPTAYRVLRRVDARDRYARHVVAAGSEFNAGTAPVIARDDAADAQAEANARRLAGEAGEVLGRVTIPWFTPAYAVGDRIRSIQGRGLSLRTNAGAPADEGEVFPAVVGLTWEFDGGQRTILHLSDERGEPR